MSMTREEAIELLRDTPIDIRSTREDDIHTLYATAQMMATDALRPVSWERVEKVCQDLSVAGKRAGLSGERSGLFMEQVRIVREMRELDKSRGRTGHLVRPRFMVWENVPGALLGEYTMRSFGECPSEENVSHLSQILEDCPHPKYCLSARACAGILTRAKRRGKKLPEELERALMAQSGASKATP